MPERRRLLDHNVRHCTGLAFCLCACRWCFWNHWRDLLQLPATTRPTQLGLLQVSNG